MGRAGCMLVSLSGELGDSCGCWCRLIAGVLSLRLGTVAWLRLLVVDVSKTVAAPVAAQLDDDRLAAEFGGLSGRTMDAVISR